MGVGVTVVVVVVVVGHKGFRLGTCSLIPQNPKPPNRSAAIEPSAQIDPQKALNSNNPQEPQHRKTHL